MKLGALRLTGWAVHVELTEFDADEEPFVAESLWHYEPEDRTGLHEALAAFGGTGFARGARADEANLWPLRIGNAGRITTFTRTERENDHAFRTGGFTTYTLHIPEHISPSSRLRVARLLGLVPRGPGETAHLRSASA